MCICLRLLRLKPLQMLLASGAQATSWDVNFAYTPDLKFAFLGMPQHSQRCIQLDVTQPCLVCNKSFGTQHAPVGSSSVIISGRDGCTSRLNSCPVAKVAPFTLGESSMVHFSRCVYCNLCCAGFNINLTPGFSPTRLAFMLGYGGILAVANLRFVVFAALFSTVHSATLHLGSSSCAEA